MTLLTEHVSSPQCPNVSAVYNSVLATLKDTKIDFPNLNTVKSSLYQHRNTSVNVNYFQKCTRFYLSDRWWWWCYVAVLPLSPENKIINGWFYIASQSPNGENSKKSFASICFSNG